MKLVKESLSDQLYQILKLKILKGTILAGSLLSNRSLQEEYHVSSSPVRDAINRLNQDGLIEEITRSGAKVISVSMEKALEYNEMLLVLTTGAMRLAFRKLPHNLLIKKLQKAVEKQKKYLETELYFRYDHEFHSVFFEASGNQRLMEDFDKLHAIMEFLVRSVHASEKEGDEGKDRFQARKKLISQHEEMIRFLLEDKIAEAVERNQEHYLHAEKVLQQIYQRV